VDLQQMIDTVRYLPRRLATTVRRALRTFPAVVVTGARQAGKTTMLRAELGDTFGFTALEDPDVLARATDDPRGFLAAHPAPRIFDEIQNAPHLLPYLKSAIDADRRAGQWILTGSQAFPLMAGVTESLAGRAAVLSLHGLAQAEIPHDLRLSTGDELLVGAFPEPRLHRDVDLRLWMASYVQTYLERDVRQLANVGDLTSFANFVRLCAARTGQLLNIAQLARDAAVSSTTARRWLAVLEASGQCRTVPAFARSATKRLVKSPKLYFTDTGLAAWLTGHRDSDVLWNGPLRGPLFESAVLAQIIAHFEDRGDRAPITMWRASDGLEVDFVLEIAGVVHGVECKANATPMPRMGDGLRKWRSLVGGRVGRTAVVCDVDSATTIAPEVDAIPWRDVGAFLDDARATA
jgi:predicted AAA+ superfamily ATPase